MSYRGFPGSSVVKNLPANVGDRDSGPDFGKIPCLGATKPVLLSPCAITTEA